MIRDLLQPHDSARKFFRSRSGSPSDSSPSTSRCVLCQTGTARTSTPRPFAVRVIRRLRRSIESAVTLTRPLRCSGLRAAVNVVRSMASSDATDAMPGASGRFNDISRENCPFVRPRGRRASSKRRASALAARWTCRHRQASRTRSVVSKGGFVTLDTVQIILISTYLAKIGTAIPGLRRNECREKPSESSQCGSS